MVLESQPRHKLTPNEEQRDAMSRRIDQLPPLTEAEQKVLGPRYGNSMGDVRVLPLENFTLPEGVLHTCVDNNVPCPACEAVDAEIARRKLCGHFALDMYGRCENCFEVIETPPLRYPASTLHYPARLPRKTTPEKLRAEADALTKAWNDICDRIGKRPA
jgi:hypothetical protein